MGCTIVPPYLLMRIAQVQEPRLAHAAAAARRALLHDVPFRNIRSVTVPRRHEAAQPGGLDRTIFDAEHTETLPGRVVRREGEAAAGDPPVDEAYDGIGHTHELFHSAFSRESIDGHGLPLAGTVHYGDDYDNAFWDGSRIVFGDGDGQVFRRFTLSLSVIGHELTHGVTGYTARLAYQGQSGALNESISDVFGAMVEQRASSQTVEEASWLIGEGVFTDQVEGNAIRSLKAPGTAYDDDVLGKDPQPDHMSGFVHTEDDNGGVHVNSGIPNRAFHLVASAIGGYAWERAGWIWYDTLTGGRLATDCSFADFAGATAEAAAARFGQGSAEWEAVNAAWKTVGVVP